MQLRPLAVLASILATASVAFAALPAKDAKSASLHGYGVIADPKPDLVIASERASYAYFKSLGLHVNIYSDGHIGFVYPEPKKHYPDELLAQMARCPALHAINLDAAQFTPAAFNQLKNLTEVDLLDLTNATDAHVAVFANMISITGANLNGPGVTDQGVKHLANLKHLILLRLNKTATTDAGVASLPNLPNFKWLELADTNITDASLKTLANCTKLECLHVAGTKITDDGLAELKNLSALDNLDLSYTAITDDGLATIAAFPALENMKAIYLRGDNITDAGMFSLAKFKNLGVIDLRETGISDDGLAALSPLKAIYNLLVNRTAVTPTAAEAFQVGRPPYTIQYDNPDSKPKSTKHVKTPQ